MKISSIKKLEDVRNFSHYKVGDRFNDQGRITNIVYIDGKYNNEKAIVLFFEDGSCGSITL
jgi:hypothetical protein